MVRHTPAQIPMSSSPLIDTNIFCYLFDARDPEKSRISRELIARCFRSERSYSVSVQNIAEFAVVMTEKIPGPFPYTLISRFISDIKRFKGWNVIHYTATSVYSAMEVQNDYSLHFWDALLAVTMKEQGINTIYTEDGHFTKIPWLITVNPYDGEGIPDSD